MDNKGKSPTQNMWEQGDYSPQHNQLDIPEPEKQETTQEADNTDYQEQDQQTKESYNESQDSISPNLIDLPSGGLLGYPATVEYRDMLAKDEEVLSSATGDTYARTLNSVLKSILNNCEFFEQICVHDRDYAILWLWSNNYTAIKDIEVQCSNQKCGKKEDIKVDLRKVPITPIKEGSKRFYEMILKNTGKPVHIRLNTVQDELNVESFLSNEQNQNYDYSYLMLVSAIDVGIDVPLDKKMQWVGDNVTAKELGLIKKFHQKYAFGVDQRIPHECPACREVTHFDLPFQTEDILFPTVSDDIEGFIRAI